VERSIELTYKVMPEQVAFSEETIVEMEEGGRIEEAFVEAASA